MIVSYKGLSASVTGGLASVVGIDGSPIVQVPDEGAYVDMTSHNYAINVRGDNTSDIFNGAWNPASSDNVVFVKAGDVMLVGDVVAPKDVFRTTPGDYPTVGDQTRSQTDAVMRVAFVSYVPTSGQLAPAAFGSMDDALVAALRGPLNAPDASLLPSVIDLSLWTDQENRTLDFDALEYIFDGFNGDCWNGWSTDNKTPARADLGGYGRNVAAWVSKACIFLASTESSASKLRLASLVTQRGIDLASAWATGRVGYANGGHNQGRTVQVVVAGIVLGMPTIATSPQWLMGDNTQEKSAFYPATPGQEWANDPSWDAMWQRTSDYTYGGTPIRLWEPPSNWTGPASLNGTEKWAFNGYYFPSCGANIGSAIFARLSGHEYVVGRSWVAGILDQYMTKPDAQTIADFLAAGISGKFGEEFPTPWAGVDTGIQKQVFDTLRAGYLI
jgi:hypothetical protein